MAKQKIVIKISMEDAKKKCKVFQAIGGQQGLISLKVDGDQVVVVGDRCINSATLTTMLRKKMKRHVELISVGADEEKESKPEAGGEAMKSTVQPPEVLWATYPYGVPAQHYPIVIRDDYEPSCNIF